MSSYLLLYLLLPQRGGADGPERESVCEPGRGVRAAGVGAPGSSLRPAAEVDPAKRGPGRAGPGETRSGGQEVPGPHSSHTPHLHRPLSGAAGHAGEGKSSQHVSKHTQCDVYSHFVWSGLIWFDLDL